MRKFLVLLDGSRECLNAIRFAAMRAAATKGGVVILAVIPTDEIQHGFGVADVMRAEAVEQIKAHFGVYAKWMRDRQGIEPALVIREGDPGEQILTLIREDLEIGVIVVGMAAEKGAKNPVLTRLMRDAATLPCPITMVPGDMAKERLEEIT